MKKAEEIKKGNVCCGSGSCDGCPYRDAEHGKDSCCDVLTKDTLTYIQQLETENDELRLAFAKQAREVEEHKLKCLKAVHQCIEKTPQWISVEERLPDEGEKVIVRGVRGGIQAGTYKGHSTSGKNVWWWAHNTYLKVSCWMPESMLPEAPKEDAPC